MKLLVLGASGGCGRVLVRRASERGHQVAALVRPEAAFEAAPGVELVRGDALDGRVMDGAIAGRDAVLSCLGLRRAGQSPWAPLLSPPDLTTRVIRLVIESMRRYGVRRIVAISAGGVADSFDELSRPIRWLVRSGNVAVAYRDLANMERELETSGMDWLAVRPVTLANGEPTGRARLVGRYGMTSRIRRADVAEWMLRQVEAPAPFVRRTVLLGA